MLTTGLHSKAPLFRSTLLLWICRCVCQAHTTKLLWIEFPVQIRGRLVPELYPHLHELWRCPVMDDGFDLIHEKIEDHHSYIEKEWIFWRPLPSTTQWLLTQVVAVEHNSIRTSISVRRTAGKLPKVFYSSSIDIASGPCYWTTFCLLHNIYK